DDGGARLGAGDALRNDGLHGVGDAGLALAAPGPVQGRLDPDLVHGSHPFGLGVRGEHTPVADSAYDALPQPYVRSGEAIDGGVRDNYVMAPSGNGDSRWLR